MLCMCALQLFDLGPDGKGMRKVDEISNLAEKAQQAVGGAKPRFTTFVFHIVAPTQLCTCLLCTDQSPEQK